MFLNIECEQLNLKIYDNKCFNVFKVVFELCIIDGNLNGKMIEFYIFIGVIGLLMIVIVICIFLIRYYLNFELYIYKFGMCL